MEIAMDAEVHCKDAVCGKTTKIILNPVSDKVSHVVVREHKAPHREVVVPVDRISEGTPELILLDMTSEELSKMDPFIEKEYVPQEMTHYEGAYMFALPYKVPEKLSVGFKHRSIPAGELAVKRGSQVEATDGHIGEVNEFLLNPDNDQITHLVIQEKGLLHHKEISIPVSEIDKIRENIVYLKISKKKVEELPTIPTQVLKHLFL
jgi:uncharacterized protein YrrD